MAIEVGIFRSGARINDKYTLFLSQTQLVWQTPIAVVVIAFKLVATEQDLDGWSASKIRGREAAVVRDSLSFSRHIQQLFVIRNAIFEHNFLFFFL